MVETETKQNETSEANRSSETKTDSQEASREAHKKEASEAQRRAEETRLDADKPLVPNTEVRNTDGSIVRTDEKGRVKEVVDATGKTRTFGYDEATGKLNSFEDETGKWTSADGKNWTNGSETRAVAATVYGDGKFAYTDGSNVTIRRTDGTTLSQDLQTQSIRIVDGNGALSETHRADGPSTTYTHENGQLATVTLPDGTVLTRQADNSFSGSNGGSYTDVSLDADGTLRYNDQNGNQIEKTAADSTKLSEPNGRITVDGQEVRPPFDTAKLSQDIDKIHTASDGAGTWEDDIYEALSGKTRDEIREMDRMYQERYGMSLEQQMRAEFEGDELYRAMKLMEGTDAATLVATSSAPQSTEQTAPAMDRAAAEAAADAIYANTEAMDGTGEDEVNALLQDKTEAEKQAIDAVYREKYGISIEQQMYRELSGSELDKSLSILHKKDGDADDAGRLHTNFSELGETLGRSNYNVEKDIRQTISTMNAEQIAQLDQEYQRRYNKTLRQALMEDPNMSQQSKDMVDIYLKGTDRRSNEDNQRLFDIALQSGDGEKFNEAMAMASPESRRAFLDNGGDKRMQDAFGTGTVYNHAKDYAENGRLSTASKVGDNSSWSGDNEEAIERSMREMPDAERQAYLTGKALSQGKDVQGLSEEEKQQARATYNRIHTALEGAGDPWEVAKWEDMMVTKGGDSLVSRLAAHRGSIYDSSTNSVLQEIEGMSEQDWQRYKSDANYRQQVDTVIKDYLSDDEYARARKALDAKLSAESYEQAKTAGKRDLDTIVNDNEGTFDNDEKAIFDAIENMSAAEQEKYRSDPEFKKKVDDAMVRSLDDGAELETARGMLDRVAAGGSAKSDIIDKLNKHASDTDTDEGAVIRDMEKAFAEDVTLRERIRNPQTDADQKYAERFNAALGRALDQHELDRYAKPLLETGRLDQTLKQELNRGDFDDSEQSSYEDMVALGKRTDAESVAEKDKILNDKNYQERVLSHLSADERAVALNALRQGELKPEDMIRAQILGAGTGEEEIKAALRDLTPEQKEEVRAAYARKYGVDMSTDIFGDLGGQDARDAQRLLARQPKTDREAFNAARDEVNLSRDGIGRSFVDNLYDGTGYMTDAAVLDMQSRISKLSAEYKEMSPEERTQLTERVQKNLDAFVQSKGAAADLLVDAVIIAGAIAGAKFTGGVSLALIAYTTLGGAAFKVLTKSTIMGADYDWGSTQVLSDALTGGIDAGTIFLGPGQLALALRLGEKSAATAARKVLMDGGEQLIKLEMRSANLAKELSKLLSTAISNGENGVSDGAIKALAQKFAAEGMEDALAQSLKVNLTSAIQAEGRSALNRMATESALNTTAGAGGGGASGATRGALEWDSSKSVGENMRMVMTQAGAGAMTGGSMAGMLTVGFKGVGVAYRSASDGITALRSAPDDLKVNVTTRDGGNTATITAESNPHIAGVQRDGQIIPLRAGEPVQLRDGDVPVARLDDAGRTVDANGTRVNSDGSEYVPELSGPPTQAFGDSTQPRATINGQEFPVGQPVVIGRTGGDAGVQIDGNMLLSRRHAEVLVDGQGNRWVRDLGSQNGTTLRDSDGTVRNVGSEWVSMNRTEKLMLGGMDVPIGTKATHRINLGGEQLELKVGEERVIGRQNFGGDNGQVSARHARVGMDQGGMYVSDGVIQPDGTLKPSTNGTYVNGQRIQAGAKVYLREGDVVRVAAEPGRSGGHDIVVRPVETAAVPVDKASTDGVKFSLGDGHVDLQPGEVVPFGRAHFVGENPKISSRHGQIGRELDGRVYIVDGVVGPDGVLRPSTNGTYVNGQRLRPGEKRYLNPDDRVRVGDDDFRPLAPERVEQHVPTDPRTFSQAVDQSNHFGKNQELRGKIRDGFGDGGKGTNYDSNGRLVDEFGNPRQSSRQVTVVDRANDPVLRATIDDARARFGHLPPRERAIALNQYVKSLMQPKNVSDQQLNDWNSAFGRQNGAQRVLLGRFISAGRGVCIQQALLLKVLGDELGLDVKLVRGHGGGDANNVMNHAWTEIYLPGEQQSLIFDPRQELDGVPYSASLPHRRGSDIVAFERGGPIQAEPHFQVSQGSPQ